MINKIKNWIKNHRYFTAAGLLIVSICAIAFGFAHFGPDNNLDSMEDDDLIQMEDPDEITETDEW